MVFEPSCLYHVYNRGNNRQEIFFNRENYLFFLRKARTHLLPFCDILCYCLMPNHFHFLISTKEMLPHNQLNNAIGILLRSYTRAINKQENRYGSLFQQDTKAKELLQSSGGSKPPDDCYPLTCFNYIHQNPMIAGLSPKMEDWEFSSFKDYAGERKGTLCNQTLARQLFDLPNDRNEFYRMSYALISPAKLEFIR
ncbi:MAG: transposase [Chitinophagales bacterium]|nr:transposase [Chitinophagales bacterium]